MTILTLPMLFILAVSLWSCVSDFRSLRIPNWHSLLIITAFGVSYALAPMTFYSLQQHIFAMIIMFIVTYIMFVKGMIGGGDAKLGTALALWLGLKNLFPFILCMSLIGGVLGLIALLLARKKIFSHPKKGSWIDQAQKGHSAVPYGIAISLGFWIEQAHAGVLRDTLQVLISYLKSTA